MAHPSVDASNALAAPLNRLRSRARRLLMTRRLALLLAAALGVALIAGLFDAWLRFPRGIRTVALLIGVGVAFHWFLRNVVPAARFAPKLTDLALRVETLRPEMRGSLASALEFANEDESQAGSPMRRQLAKVVVDRAVEQVKALSPGALLQPKGARHGVLTLGGVALVALALALITPQMVAIGAKRIITPWSDAQWPKRTAVADATALTVHPLGQAVAVRGVVTKSPGALRDTDVRVEYRFIGSPQGKATRRELLTFQGTATRQEKTGGPVELDPSGTTALFERLIEPMGTELEYRFTTEDDSTAWRKILLVEPPKVASASLAVEPPAYAQALLADRYAEPIDLGAGNDERAAPQPILEGSRLTLTIEANKAAELASTLPEGVTMTPINDGEAMALAFTLSEALRIEVGLVDEYGITSPSPAVFRLTPSADEPAAATVTAPGADLTALASAVIDVVGEGRDDVGLDALEIEQTIRVPAGMDEPSGPGGATEDRGAPTKIAQRSVVNERTATLATTLDLSTLDVQPGDEVRLVVIASDIRAASGEGPATRSTARLIRIIDETELLEQVREDLNELRQSAIRIESQQEQVQEQTEQAGASRAARRGQAQVNDRLRRQQDTLDDLRERLEENRLDDDALDALLDRVQQGLDRANQAAARASENLDRAGTRADAQERANAEAGEQNASEGQPQGEEDPDAEAPGEDARGFEGEEEAQTQDAQDEVRDELAGVVSALDRGEDAWVVRRTLERLLREQRELQAQTAQAGQDAAGQATEDLTQEQRDELEDIARQQEELAQRTQEAIRDLQERAEELEESDPTTSMGLEQAAQSAQENQVAQAMQQAAQQAQQNQTQQAQQNQERAAEALEQALEDLDAGERAREQVLKRVLASMIEALDGLIADQTDQLAALADAGEDGGALRALDAGMIRLNQNTLGVIDTAKSTGPELEPIASLLDRAASAQVQAISSLRAEAIDTATVERSEERSLELLKQAKERAEALEEQIEQEEQDRLREELKAAYTSALRAQVAIAEETMPLADQVQRGDRLSRRDRVTLTRQSEPQGEIVTMLNEIAQMSDALDEARVFGFAHRRATRSASGAQASLADAEAPAAAIDQRSTIAALQAIVEALNEPPPDDQPFVDEGQNQQAGGGGGGGGGGDDQPLIPPIEELRLLRLIQIDLADRTAATDALPNDQKARMASGLAAEQAELAQVGSELLGRMGMSANIPELFPEQPETPMLDDQGAGNEGEAQGVDPIDGESP